MRIHTKAGPGGFGSFTYGVFDEARPPAESAAGGRPRGVRHDGQVKGRWRRGADGRLTLHWSAPR
jgi:hypothetical protein